MTDEARLDELLSLWQAGRAGGRDVTAAELCRDYPELLPELERQMAVLRGMAGLAAGATASFGTADSIPQIGTVPGSGGPLPDVAGYELLGELGRGGMGVVYRARHTRLKRIVALKVILSGGHAGEADLARFRTEAESIARLQHPHIVQIHDVGDHDGVPYFSLEFCAGGSLEKRLSATPLLPNDAARLIETLARAMQMAHEKGIVHRDLKPANVLLTEDGTPKVSDFGLARKLDEAGQTASGAVMGTPSYMAPEQARGETQAVGPACDVYALGAILYECMTGRPPFRAPTAVDTLMQVVSREPPKPRVLQPTTPVDLETVCLKCLRKEPGRRYASAGALADDLQRFREGRPIEARPVGWGERGTKWVRRNPAWAAGLACILAALISTGFFAYQAHHEGQARETENRQNALDKALTAAMGGDLEAAELAITDAERLGASTGQVRMLRGQVGLHRGKTQEAIRDLEQAVQLLPESVAARGMLAVAYAYDGQWDQFGKALVEMELLSPETPEDFLFKGYAEAEHDPERGLRAINEAIRRRPSMTIARLIRAEVHAWHAQEKGDPEEAERAVRETAYARDLLPDNPEAICASLEAQLTAAGVYARVGQPEKRSAALSRAGADAQALEAYPALPDALVFRWQYFREVGREADLLEELRRASEQTEHVYVAFYYALTLYQRGEINETLRVLDNKHGCCSDCLRLFALAEDRNDRGRLRVKEAYKDLTGRYQDGPTLMTAQTVLRLLGENQAAVEACRELREHPGWFPVLLGKQQLQFLNYNAGELSAEDLETAAKGSLWDQAQAHYFIGMTKLSDGDRVGASEHFRKAVATRAFFFNTFDLSWAFLARLEKDPTWPSWIQGKK